MLIPFVTEEAESENVDWIRRVYATCGTLSFNRIGQVPPQWRGRKLMVNGFEADLELAGEFLNSGVAQIAIESAYAEAFAEAYPSDRLVVKTNSEEDVVRIFGLGKITGFILTVETTTIPSDWTNAARRILTRCPGLRFLAINCPVSLTFPPSIIEQACGELHRLVKDRPVHLVCEVKEQGVLEQPVGLSPARCLLNCLAPSDRADGLIPTVVCDERGVSLGLVYSNALSVVTSTGAGRGVYWSRSRNELWRKGDTSGAVQDLLAMAMDCDQDCLRFTVVQRGAPPAFCHTGDRSCWGEDGGISHLFRTLVDRKQAAPPGSYTARLFADMGLLRDKLLEEAAELAEAVKGTAEGADTSAHVEEETADVLYFALTACVAGGGNLLEVEKQLDKRSLAVKRRKGDAKQARRDETEQRLKEIADENEQKKKLKQ